MKVPLRYQNTEYDCGTTSFVNALAYLYDREDVPVELLKAIYKFTLDVDPSRRPFQVSYRRLSPKP